MTLLPDAGFLLDFLFSRRTPEMPEPVTITDATINALVIACARFYVAKETQEAVYLAELRINPPDALAPLKADADIAKARYSGFMVALANIGLDATVDDAAKALVRDLQLPPP